MIRKSLVIILMFTALSATAALVMAEEGSSAVPFSLEENATQAYQIKQAKSNAAEQRKPQIIKEDIEGGFIEKLVDAKGRIVAEKKVKDGKVVQKILNYYSPDDHLLRRVTALEGQREFFAEEYYANGHLAAQASFLNENNKIGEEKKYDVNGILRQVITWVLPQSQEEQQKTVRYGEVITYYPDGAKAASFSVGKKGKNIFYNHDGGIIKEIDDAEILNFAQEQMAVGCDEKAVRLSLEELVELYEDEGDISYNKCGLPYRETFVYEVTEQNGDSALKISYDETGQIRRLTPYVAGKKQGKEQKFDASGNLTAEINYENGEKNGEAVGYFPTKEKAFYKQYADGKVIGLLTCYFPSGEIAAQFQYQNGVKEGRAQINSPVVQQLEFINGRLANAAETPSERRLVSLLSGLETPDEKCLKAADKIVALELDVEAIEQQINHTFSMSEPSECKDVSAFVRENDNHVCYDDAKTVRAVYPAAYAEGKYAVAKIYAADGQHLLDIPYMAQKRQGIAKQYAPDGQVIAEAYYDKGALNDNSRSYYANGVVKEMLSISDDKQRKVITRYSPDGILLFSLSYKDGEKNQAFLSDAAKNKDVFVTYYQNVVDEIREANSDKPYNYIKYNLALGEYAVYRENELIKGGKICFDERLSPVISEENAPLVDDLEPISADDLAALDELATEAEAQENALQNTQDYKLENALIPTESEKKQAELAAKNIGPIAKPDIEELAAAVSKKSMNAGEKKSEESALPKTEKFYYPNGNLRKTIQTKGARTEEVKEYSKTGLLLADTLYNKDNIQIEKYFGSGQIRRKSQKAYDDNAVMAFLSREDFYDNGKPRYTISRLPDVLLFEEKVYAPTGLKQETVQKSPLSFLIHEYTADEKLQKTVETLGANKAVKEYDADGKVVSFSLNGKSMPLTMADKSTTILKENAKVYDKGVLKAEIKANDKQTALIEYHPAKIIKTEIVFFNNGEISVKGYAKDGTLEKFAYLAPDGKLHIQKPEVRTIPNYRERYWVDYNNPHWIENNDKYSVKSISRLYLDTAAYILAELEWDVPEQLQKLYAVY